MAEALISVLLEQLALVVYERTYEKVKLVLNADQDVEAFRSNLKAIQAVLKDAEKKQVTEDGVADWLEKLKDVSYEMDDVLDEWNTELLRQQVEEKLDEGEGTKKKVCFPTPSGCLCFGKVNKVTHNHNIAKRIKELDDKLTLIADERKRYHFRESRVVGPDDQQVIHQPQTSSLLDESKIFGRDEEKKDLLRKLLRESSQEEEGRFLVIPIVGMGGMGKTTFAQLAFNNEKVKAHFDKKVWVCVSDPFDEIKIAKLIMEGLGGVQSSSNGLETLLTGISSQVENKKFLLILDDVWTEDPRKWESLKLAEIMQTCAEGSNILVTTRKEGVARMMRATSNMIDLDKLSDEDSLTLFKSIAFSDKEEVDGSSEFGVIGEEIVKKCKGLPLAIKTLASQLRFKKTIREWRDVLNSEIWELKEVEDQVFQPLLLSYYDLNPPVRRCLLYCATFPKDHMLIKDQLIELWMSQDYLTSKENNKKRRLGQDYFESLAMRSFFQDFNKDELGNVESCKMHDIVHDFVQFLGKRECITIEGGSQQMEVEANKIRHLTLTSVPEGPLSLPTSFYTQNKVRSLTLLDSKITAVSSGTIRQMKCLRTLNLSASNLEELPKEIGELIHLRYMDLSQSYLKVLPEAVCDLINLQTLDVRSCHHLEKLPKGMGKLINLKHLYVGWCTLRYLPKGIGSLKSLQVLDCFYVCEGEDEALKLGDLGSMDQLQGSLKIEGLGNKDDASAIEKAQLGNKEHLSHLGVEFREDEAEQREAGDSEIVKALRPHQNLESLFIRNCHGTTESLNWIFNSSYHNLRHVSLSDWTFCQVLPPLGKLPSLEVLVICLMEKVKKVGVEFLGTQQGIVFPKLKRLSFHYMRDWEEWEGITEDSSEITIMPHLSSLQFDDCPNLKALPDFLYKITELRTLEIERCPILEREYKESVGKEWHNISHIPDLTIRS